MTDPGIPVVEYIEDHTHETKSKDVLLDVRIGNPLKRITEILEEIKKQKAFTFTLKGSLGIMGVVFSLSMLGLLGSNKILCDKGIQTQRGVVKVLAIENYDPSPVPVLGTFIDWFSSLVDPKKELHKRVVLDTSTGEFVFIPHGRVNVEKYNKEVVIATGQYNECEQVLRITYADGIQIDK